MKKIFYSICMAVLPVLSSSCGDDWLEPKPLSFFEPDITLSSKEGMEAALTTCHKQLMYYYMGMDGSPLATEMMFSDVAVTAVTDLSGCQDISYFLTPTSNNSWFGTNMTQWYWKTAYEGISYANVVISRMEHLSLDDETKRQMLSRAYFQRAFRYYHLINQFGDIPFLTKEVSEPKFDFYSVKMEVIIEQMIKDLEYAVANIAERDDYGKENKGACQMLLIKYYLAAKEFDKAVEQANMLINSSGYSLMQDNFGEFENPYPEDHPISRNVIWDLHRPVNKSIASNTEAIMVMINRYEREDTRMKSMFLANMTPYWAHTDATRGILIPDKSALGMSWQAGTPTFMEKVPTYKDYRAIFGRGEAYSRPTYWAEKGMWKDSDDLRHDRKSGNWFVMEDLKYNNPAILQSENGKEYYMNSVQKYAADGTLLCGDTIRCWFDWPYYKLWIRDDECEVSNGYGNVYYQGGSGDWYLYRLAEAYLLRAEAYYWKREYALAAEDVNAIRQRAHCSIFFTAADMEGINGLDVIMDERARELMYEELRHVELVRVSFIKACLEGAYSSPKSLADENSNSYWWYRISKYNNYYNKGVVTLHNDEYRISKYNIFFPIPQSSVDANLYKHINQNYGYSGCEENIEPICSLEEFEKINQ